MSIQKRLFPLAGLLMACTGIAQAQTEVTKGVMQGKDYGVTYLLPRTEIVLTLHATKYSYTPGEFCKYAERYLRQSDVSTEPNEYWGLDGVEIGIAGVPDKEKVYFVKLKDKSTAPLMELTEEGVIRSINLPYSGKRTEETTPQTMTTKTTPDADPNAYLTEEILMAGSTAKQAELVAKEIYNIRESRNALTRGEADFMPQDEGQLKLMLENLDKQKAALTGMFTGTQREEHHTFTVRVLPKEMDNALAFRFSRKVGIVDNDDLIGEPAYISITDLKLFGGRETVDTETGKRVEGIAYNAPGMARVSVSFNGKQLAKSRVPLTQFGIIEYLAPALFNKNAPTTVLFDTATGGLVKIDRGE